MWFAGGKCSSFRSCPSLLLTLLILSLLFHQPLAARSSPATRGANMRISSTASHQNSQELFNSYNYYRATRSPPFNSASGGSAGRVGLDESKRRVPSCPDPLHN